MDVLDLLSTYSQRAREMAILDEEPEDDPLDWELEKIEKLKRLADAYGWDEE